MATQTTTAAAVVVDAAVKATAYWRIAVRRGPAWVAAMTADYAACCVRDGLGVAEYVAGLDEWAAEYPLEVYLAETGATVPAMPKGDTKPQPKPEPVVDKDAARLAMLEAVIEALTADARRLDGWLDGVRRRLSDAKSERDTLRKLAKVTNREPLPTAAETTAQHIAQQPKPEPVAEPVAVKPAAMTELAAVYAEHIPAGRMAALNAVAKRLMGKTLPELRLVAAAHGVTVPAGLTPDMETHKLMDRLMDAAERGTKPAASVPQTAMAAQQTAKPETKPAAKPEPKPAAKPVTVDDDTPEVNAVVAKAFRLGLRHRKGETVDSLKARIAAKVAGK